jgi:crotonobetainyl-CoA:carnitine CoA-transferase CaiB-like acyl-CoA transferase
MTAVLGNIRVIETANFVSGPYVGQLLADLGAEVIKIENPDGGDPFRGLSPDGYSADFCAYNPNKKSVCIDLTKPDGRALVVRLARSSDVLIENFRPGVMDRLQLGWDQLSAANAKLIYCSITGFGPDGPYRHRPAYDSVAGALSGFFGQILQSDRPQIVGPALCDAVTGLYGAYAIMGGLIERGQTGVGKRIDVTMMEAMIAFLRQPLMKFFFTGRTPTPLDRPAGSMCFALACADARCIVIHLSTPDKFWLSLLQAIESPGLNSDPRFSSRELRIQNYLLLNAELQPIFQRKSRGDWMSILDKLDVPFAPMNDFQDVMDDPQAVHLGIFPASGLSGLPQYQIACPVRYDSRRPTDALPAPRLGEHTSSVLTELGLSEAEQNRLRCARVIA